jgi:ABC-2 type transport system permease protein
MMAVSIATVIVFTVSVSALALAIGTLYPQYDTENAAQIPTSFGGLVFMLLAIALLGAIIVLEAFPVVDYLAQVRAGRDPSIGAGGILAFTAAGVLAILTGWIPLSRAVAKLERLEA